MNNPNDYFKRLNQFNSSEKYQNEMQFLLNLLQPVNKNEIILDYGCGTGTLIKFLKTNTQSNVSGFDIHNYMHPEISHLLIKEISSKYDKIIFMHSLAHIQNLDKILIKLKLNLSEDGKIFVITPNKDFDDYFKKIKEQNYIPDQTVVKHYNLEELQNLFTFCDYQVHFIGKFGKLIGNIHERCFLIAGNNKF